MWQNAKSNLLHRQKMVQPNRTEPNLTAARLRLSQRRFLSLLCCALALLVLL